MLKIIDRYIIRKFLTTFFFMMGVIMLLAVIFDLSERLQEFIENKAPFKAIVLDYYVNFIFFYGNMFSALIIFISVIWFTAKMAQNTEIIPMLNSGRPFHRFLRPYMIGATLLTLMSLAMNHFILPSANAKRLGFEEEFYRFSLSVSNYHADFPNGESVYFKNYKSDQGYIQDFYMEKWSEDNKLEYFLSAKRLRPTGDKTWTLEDYFVRKVGQTGDEIVHGDKMDTIFAFGIDEFARRDNIVETMDYEELNNFIEREKQKGNENVPAFELVKHQRTSYPFASYVLTLIGVAVSSRKSRGGIGVHIATGLAFVFIYIFAMQVTSVAAINIGFPTLLASWIPNLVFGVIGLVLYRLAPK